MNRSDTSNSNPSGLRPCESNGSPCFEDSIDFCRLAPNDRPTESSMNESSQSCQMSVNNQKEDQCLPEKWFEIENGDTNQTTVDRERPTSCTTTSTSTKNTMATLSRNTTQQGGEKAT
mmetsp:Transcript_24437/g.39956  ORF Transcript_24437/g.39956 Transcript_24437/m.39956 type:complete len:118 (+) Transcript_24437:265-618(+)